MTTIAIDHDTCVADGLLTIGDSVTVPYAGGKIKKVKGCVFGCVGTPVLDPLIKWWFGGCKKEEAPECEWEMIVWNGKKWLDYANDRHYPVEVCLPFAVGTGSDIAMGALYNGATALEAVKIASQLDNCTGGKCKSISYRKG